VFGKPTVPRLTFRELADLFLAEKRKVLGRDTAADYASRLRPVIDFAELPASLKRWPFAASADRDFVVELRAHLHRCRVTRNGRPGAAPKLMSATQVYNVLDCLRTMFNWANRADTRKLPAGWVNPLTPDVVGSPPSKDPLRPDKLPLPDRVRLAGLMDRWQLTHLSISLVLPMRPAEVTGLLVSEVDFENGWLVVGSRLGGDDATKEGTSFHMPFPDELRPVFRELVGGRPEGPLLRSRGAYTRLSRRQIGSFRELELLYQNRLTRASDWVQAPRDRKRAFRCLLQELGGASPDELAREFKVLLRAAGLGDGRSLYTLRHSVTHAMKAAGIHELDLMYLTSHSTGGILNRYTPVDPVGAMRRYFKAIRPLLGAISERARQVGLERG
jgi:integrase